MQTLRLRLILTAAERRVHRGTLEREVWVVPHRTDLLGRAGHRLAGGRSTRIHLGWMRRSGGCRVRRTNRPPRLVVRRRERAKRTRARRRQPRRSRRFMLKRFLGSLGSFGIRLFRGRCWMFLICPLAPRQETRRLEGLFWFLEGFLGGGFGLSELNASPSGVGAGVSFFNDDSCLWGLGRFSCVGKCP